MRDPLIMVVDDQTSQRLLTGESLLRGGYSVLEAESGQAALTQFGNCAVDAIVLDVMMPGISGFEVCQRIRELHCGRHIPIMMVTACDDDESISQAYASGATDFIAKPINPIILRQRVASMLRATADANSLRRSQMMLAHAEQMAMTGSWEWNCHRSSVEFTEGFRQLFCLGDASPDLNALLSVYPADAQCELRNFLASEQVTSLLLEHAANERSYVSRIARRVHDLSGHTLVSATVQDVTEQRQSEHEIRQLAFFDALTGLPNRLQFAAALRVMLDEVSPRRQVTVCHLGFDGFKSVNEVNGRETGDHLLCQVAGRLQQVLAGFSSVVARLEGDEFVLAFANDSEAVRESVLQQLHQVLAQPFETSHRCHRLTTRFGIATSPKDGGDVTNLLSRAESALNEANRQGGDRTVFYADDIHQRLVQRVAMEAELRVAVEAGALEVFYQPKVNVLMNQVAGMEALVRWRTESGLVSPALFIPIAEESDLISDIGRFVLKSACQQAADWLAMGMPELQIAVNLSVKDMAQSVICDDVRQVLLDTGLPPHLLCLEITEGIMMADHEKSLETLQQLKGLGCRIAIDDFGTGYSSLSYLQSFPIDILKIDQSFVRDLACNRERHTIVSAVVRMAQTLGLKVVAEGVEDQTQQQILRSMACDEIQGFLYSRPLPAAEYEDWLQDRLSVSRVLKAV